MIEPFFSHLSHKKWWFGHFLNGNNKTRVGDSNIQPLAENGLGVPHLRLSQVGDRQESLPVGSDQGQKSVPPERVRRAPSCFAATTPYSPTSAAAHGGGSCCLQTRRGTTGAEMSNDQLLKKTGLNPWISSGTIKTSAISTKHNQGSCQMLVTVSWDLCA